MSNMPAVAELMKTTYCTGDNSKCARFMVSSTGIAVPGDLYPNDWDRAKRMTGAK